MLDCIFRPEFAEQYPVFLVNREEVVRRLHLPDQADKRKKYSYAQIAEHWEEMTRAVRGNPAAGRNGFDGSPEGNPGPFPQL